MIEYFRVAMVTIAVSRKQSRMGMERTHHVNRYHLACGPAWIAGALRVESCLVLATDTGGGWNVSFVHTCAVHGRKDVVPLII